MGGAALEHFLLQLQSQYKDKILSFELPWFQLSLFLLSHNRITPRSRAGTGTVEKNVRRAAVYGTIDLFSEFLEMELGRLIWLKDNPCV